MIIWIASYPRSGNNFTRNTLERVFGIKTHAIYDEPRQPKIDVATARASDETFLVKTHDLPIDDSPALYLVRDGRDALVSYARLTYVEYTFDKNPIANLLVYPAYALQYFQTQRSKQPQSFKSFRVFAERYKRGRVKPPSAEDLWQFLHDIIVNEQIFGGWGPNVETWTNRQAPTQVIKFEDLVQSSDLGSLLQGCFQTLGYPLGPALRSPTSFAQLKQTRPDLYRKGQVGSHRDEMPADLEALFWERYGHIMERFGYSR
jgi:hypothetical protein